MSAKLISVPDKTIALTDGQGKETGVMKNTLMQFMMIVVEGTPQANDTDAFLAHSIREKIDAYTGEPTLELDDTEIMFLQGGIQKLRDRSGISGSSWYYLISALRDAKLK